MINDPTYEKNLIDANPVWKKAFYLSEMKNDNAPLGWGDYISEAEEVLEQEGVNEGGQDGYKHGI